MPFALVFVGMILVITGFQNTYQEFGAQVQKDFTGNNSFIWWIISLGVVGSIGYVPSLQTPSRMFMLLIIVVMFLANKGGVFSQFNSAVTAGSNAPVNPVGAGVPASSGGSSGASSDSGGIGGVVQAAGTVAEIASFF